MILKKSNVKLIVIALSFAAFLLSNIYAETFNVQIQPLKSKIFLGDKVKFLIKITSDKKILNIKTDLSEKLKNFEISDIEKNLEKSKIIYGFYLQFFKTGEITLPVVQFNVKVDDGIYKVYTEKLKLNILSNLTDNVSLKPIKSPEKVGFYLTTKELILLIVILIVLAILIYLILKFLRNKKSIKEKHTVKLPPYEEIQLFFNNGSNLIQEGKIREFYFGISEAVRIYTDRLYNMSTLESTIKEIEKIFKIDNNMDIGIKNNLLNLYRKWEFYKFTDNLPDKETAIKDLKAVKEIVEKIKLETEKNV